MIKNTKNSASLENDEIKRMVDERSTKNIVYNKLSY